jgi:oxygen-dependent protoporphyrinogen oxidase
MQTDPPSPAMETDPPSPTMETDLLVVGAGPAGLAHAFWRQHAEPHLDLCVVDRCPEPGGWVRTRRIEGFLCEQGPQGVRPDAVSDAFFDALGITGQIVPASPAARQRFIARDGTLHPLPTGPGGLFKTDIFTLAGKLSLCLEPFRGTHGDAEESLADFVGRRFGSQAVPLAEAMASGVYGGDAHQIEMGSAFPAVKNLEHQHGSLLRGMIKRRRAAKGRPEPKRPPLHSFRSGMETMVQAIRTRLARHLRLGREVTAIRRRDERWVVTLGGEVETQIAARELVLAIPARRAAELLRELDPELAASLALTPFASVANVYLGFWRSDVEDQLSGFGFLLDRRENSKVLGAMYCSSFFPDHAPADKFLVRVMAGGVLHPEAVEATDAALISDAEKLLRGYTGITGPLIFSRVSRARDAIPQYIRGHGSRLRQVRALTARHEGLRLIGNSYDAVSVVGQLAQPDHLADPVDR